MTLYLRVGVGDAIYLVDAAHVAELGRYEPGAGGTAPEIDCRRLFGTPADALGYRVRLSADTADDAHLVVDRLDGLVELGDDAFRSLPAIGRLGKLFDAVAVPPAAEPPALRLHIGAALFAAAEVSRGETDG